MPKSADTVARFNPDPRDEQRGNGLQNLVAHYQKLFDRRENRDHYSPEDYQNAQRSFVKYLLRNRGLLER